MRFSFSSKTNFSRTSSSPYHYPHGPRAETYADQPHSTHPPRTTTSYGSKGMSVLCKEGSFRGFLPTEVKHVLSPAKQGILVSEARCAPDNRFCLPAKNLSNSGQTTIEALIDSGAENNNLPRPGGPTCTHHPCSTSIHPSGGGHQETYHTHHPQGSPSSTHHLIISSSPAIRVR